MFFFFSPGSAQNTVGSGKLVVLADGQGIQNAGRCFVVGQRMALAQVCKLPDGEGLLMS